MSNYLAQLWGITIVAVSLAILAKPKLLEGLFTEAENKVTMFFWGVVTVAVGTAMVFTHNVWTPDWRVVITILGWLTLVKGLDILLLPKRMRKRWARVRNQQWRVIFTLLLLGGLVFIYLGFAA